MLPFDKHTTHYHLSSIEYTHRAIVNDSFKTDCHLIFPPYKIALAALFMAAHASGENLFEWFEGLYIDTDQVCNKTRSFPLSLFLCAISHFSCLFESGDPSGHRAHKRL
jgi:hypothetical protein